MSTRLYIPDIHSQTEGFSFKTYVLPAADSAETRVPCPQQSCGFTAASSFSCSPGYYCPQTMTQVCRCFSRGQSHLRFSQHSLLQSSLSQPLSFPSLSPHFCFVSSEPAVFIPLVAWMPNSFTRSRPKCLSNTSCSCFGLVYLFVTPLLYHTLTTP